MNSGFVYILINHSMSDVIKVGKTKRDSQARAKELSNTSVPTPFRVAFEVFSDDMDNLERKMHDELTDFRIASNREFFRYPLHKAIELLIEFNSPPKDIDSSYTSISIFERLIEKYPDYLKPDIAEVKLIQSADRVWLEITSEELIAGYLLNQIIKRYDLGFIMEDFSELFFAATVDIQINADRFVEEFGSYSIANTTDLFSEEAWEKIKAEHEVNPLITL